MMHCGKGRGAEFDPKPSHNALDLLLFPSHTSSFLRSTLYLMCEILDNKDIDLSGAVDLDYLVSVTPVAHHS